MTEIPTVNVSFFPLHSLSLTSFNTAPDHFLLSPSPCTNQAVSTFITSVNTFALSGLLALSVNVYGGVAECSLEREFSNSYQELSGSEVRV